MPDSLKPVGLTIRVYGIFVDAGQRILLSDEFRMGMRMTKFPGGGLQLGEGPEDCLRRECREELGQEVEILSHIYTTGFYQPTWLLPEPRQLISIYYRILVPEPFHFQLSSEAFAYADEVEGAQSFRLRSLKEMQEDELTFPIDRYVFKLLQGSA